jgi:hypothetical protein
VVSLVINFFRVCGIIGHYFLQGTLKELMTNNTTLTLKEIMTNNTTHPEEINDQ